MTWIKCSDRLPVKNGIYEVVYERDDLCERTCSREWFIDGCWVLPPISVNSEIIYWMPLPEPPKDLMTNWIDFRKEKPKQDTVAIVFNEKGFMCGTTIRAIYHASYDVWCIYDLRYRESITLEVTHYLPIPNPPKKK
jgi:hypothetical protein